MSLTTPSAALASVQDPATEVLHGTVLMDPYRWLEEQDSPETRTWLDGQRVRTDSYFANLPGRERLRARVSELLASETVSEAWKVGHRYFYLHRAAGAEQPAIMVREGTNGEAVTLVQLNEPSLSLNIVGISNDAALLAYGIRTGGTDFQTIGFLDVNRKRILEDRLPDGFGPGLVFSSDGTGFYYSHEVLASPRPNYRAVYWHQFGTSLHDDRECFHAGEDPALHVGVIGSWDGRLLVFLSWSTLKTEEIAAELFVQDLERESTPRKILSSNGHVFVPFFVGNRLLVLTDQGAPNLRIVFIDLECPEPDHWQDVVPEGAGRIVQFAPLEGFVCATYSDRLHTTIKTFDLRGHLHEEFETPAFGTATLLTRPIRSDTLFYSFSSLAQPPTIFSYCPGKSERQLWSQADPQLDVPPLEIEQVRYASHDGTEIPMTLAYRKGSRPQVAFLTAYGGFGVNFAPRFSAFCYFLIEEGFLVAMPNIRGGGELGKEWHDAGRRHNRQNAIDDFICAAEWLVATGRTTNNKLAIGGGSNGGLLVGAALTQRPDLFSAVVCLGPLLDMLRYHHFDSAISFADEYGTADNAEDFPHLLSYSPYHRIADGVRYPAVLFISGDADTRCNPMHSRKMTARLQAATSSGNPVLLDYKPSWGHISAQPLSSRVKALVNRLAFVCNELNVTIEGGPSI